MEAIVGHELTPFARDIEDAVQQWGPKLDNLVESSGAVAESYVERWVSSRAGWQGRGARSTEVRE